MKYRNKHADQWQGTKLCPLFSTNRNFLFVEIPRLMSGRLSMELQE